MLLRQPARRLRRRRARREHARFYSQFVGPGTLCFDVGSNFGGRVAIFLSLGARVVAVEPQAACQESLRARFGRDARFTLVGCALGAEPGRAQLRAPFPGSTIGTMSTDWLDRVRASRRFGATVWSEMEDVEVQTLDALVERFGTPEFCKVDVEGYEHEVLRGLSRPLPALSLEFTPEHSDSTRSCVAQLEALGAYAFNYSLGESFVFELDDWVSGARLLESLASVEGSFGDVYARLSH
jgi:FkbM family methyltransferase